MLWSLFQPPERNRSHYLFLLACISTSSFLSTRTLAPRYSPSRIQALDISIFRLFLHFLPQPTDVHTAHFRLELHLMCMSHVFLPETIEGNAKAICVCYITLPSSISRVPRAHIAGISEIYPNICLIRPMFVPFFPFFCAVCLIFIVKSGYLTDIDAFGAFRQEEDYRLVIYCHVASAFLCNMSIIAAIFCIFLVCYILCYILYSSSWLTTISCSIAVVCPAATPSVLSGMKRILIVAKMIITSWAIPG